jgi:hypothetical protein
LSYDVRPRGAAWPFAPCLRAPHIAGHACQATARTRFCAQSTLRCTRPRLARRRRALQQGAHAPSTRTHTAHGERPW